MSLSKNKKTTLFDDTFQLQILIFKTIFLITNICFFLNCFVIILKFSSFFKSQEICNDPVQCKERHVYCSVCIRDWLRTHKTCPMGYALTVETLERTRALKDIIDDKEIYFLLFDSHAGYALKLAISVSMTGES